VGPLVETTVPGPSVIVTDTVTVIVIGVIISITTTITITITITIIVLCCKGVFFARKTNSSCADVLDPRISRLKELLRSDSLDYKYYTHLRVNYTYSHALKFL
jgi:amino acid transporter